MQAERLDRRQEHDLVTADREAAGAHRLGNVTRRDRAVELSGFTRLTDDDEALALELFGDGGSPRS